jgi:hypothetical protein
MSTSTTQRHKVWIWNSIPHEAQLEDKKPKKPKKKQREAQAQTLPNTQCKLSPLCRIYHISFLNHSVSKRVLLTLCTFSPPLTMNSSNRNWEKHEMLCMRSKLGCFTRYISRYVSNYTQPLCHDLKKQELILTRRPLRDNKHVARN